MGYCSAVCVLTIPFLPPLPPCPPSSCPRRDLHRGGLQPGQCSCAFVLTASLFSTAAAVAQPLCAGVISTEVGYSQGKVEEPSYEQVCSGSTGHAEVVQVTYDSQQVRSILSCNIVY